jgi:hypothetical protein
MKRTYLGLSAALAAFLLGTLGCGSNNALPSGTPQLSFVNSSITVLGDDDAQGVVAADFNLDGKMDLALANASSVDILLGNGDGTFTSAPTLEFQAPQLFNNVGLVVADFNRDGKPDIAVNVSSSFQVVIFLGNGDGTFTQMPTSYETSGWNLVTGDFNGDGLPDLIAGTTVLLGNGDGTFTPVKTPLPALPSTAMAVGDFNGDGKLDLAGLNDSGVVILLGNGDGTFTETPSIFKTGLGPYSITVGDFNRDGKLDLATANQNEGGLSPGTVTVLLGNGDGTFTPTPVSPTTGALPWSITVADLNGDGIPDLVTPNVSTNDITVLLGNGDGTFAAPLTFAAGSHPEYAAVGDFTGTGIPDLAIADQGGWLKILLTQPGQTPPSH